MIGGGEVERGLNYASLMSPTSDALTRPLNASFNSAYRLTLRALSAGVRHHPTATRNLRRLYRPAFREARKLLHEYTGNPSDEAGARLRDWNERCKRAPIKNLTASV